MAVKEQAEKVVSDDVRNNYSGRMVRTLFIALFPSVLLAGDYGMGYAASLLLKGSLIFFQFVILKNILDDYYRYLN